VGPGNGFAASELGAEETASETIAEVAGEAAVRFVDDAFAGTVAAAAKTTGTGIITFDEADLARRRFGRFLANAVASKQKMTAMTAIEITIVRRFGLGMVSFSRKDFLR